MALPTSGSAWADKRLLVLFLTIFIDLMGFGIFIPVIPVYARALHASDALVGDLGALFSLMMFIATPVWGSLSDRYGRRPVILLAIAISAASYVLFAHSTTLVLLVVSRMLTGLGSGNITAAQAYVTDITPPEGRAKAMGLIGAAFGLGFIFGPPLGGFIYARYGVEWVGYLAAAICLLNLWAVWVWLPESIARRDRGRKVRLMPVSGVLRALKDVRFRDLYVMSFVFITAFSMMQMTIALLWIDDYGLSDEQVGLMFAAVGVASAIVQGGLIGWLQRTFGERKLLLYGSACMVVGLAMIPFIPPAWAWFIPLSAVSIALLALGSGCLNPTLLSLLSRNAGQHEQGEVLGVNQSFGSLARVAGPALGGRLYTLGHALPYVTAGAIMLAVVLHLRSGRGVRDAGA
ncbi:MAG: MFS transporter [Flavobacteriales bacterium]|nr:Tetracycline resistance protein, class C [Flavobacteriales bacterium]MCC6578341.1 MFS transporter [Flavobacteriales bacterium]NUQ13698.1 MFS transporter [Flavobacteriales bacterium]